MGSLLVRVRRNFDRVGDDRELKFSFIFMPGVAGMALCCALGSPANTRAEVRVSTRVVVQDAGVSRTLSTLRVTGSTQIEPVKILAASGLKVGQKVDEAALKEAAGALERTGLFSHVGYRFAADPKGFAVVLEVIDAERVPVLYDNFPWFTDEELVAELKSTVPLFTAELPKQGTVLDQVADALTALLPRRHAAGVVVHELGNFPGTQDAMQRFRVEGSALKIESLEFTDAIAREDHAVRQGTHELIGQNYSRLAIEEFEYQQVRPVYLTDGHLGVKFGMPTARYTGDPNKPAKNSVAVVAPIEAGPKYQWDGVTWEGNKVIATAQLDGLPGLKRGDVANGVQIEAGWLAVRDAYLKMGYLEVQVHEAAHLDEAAKRASYKVSIVEGPQYRMGKLVLTGLSSQDQKLIEDAWRLKAGEPLDETYLSQFVEQGAHEALAGLPVRYDKITYYLEKNTQAGSADVMIDFQ